MTAPFCSIIVPTFDRNASLTGCVQALRGLDYPCDRFEIIIVDDGSRVPVKLSDPHPGNGVLTTVLRQSNGGPASARNLGARHARGDILAFTDDDCAPDPHWLIEMTRSFDDVPGGLFGGRTINGLVDNAYSSASQMIVDEAYAYFLKRESDLRFFSSNNMVVSAQLFHEHGGFDSSFQTSEDRDFCDRWIRRGHPLVYIPHAIVHHRHHLTFTTFFRQHFHYGRGAYQFYRGRAQRGGTLLKPDLGFYASVFCKALFAPGRQNPLPMAGLMGLWQAANLAGFVWQAVHPNSALPASCHAQGSRNPMRPDDRVALETKAEK